MFIGHFGAGLAGKKPAPEISLGNLFMASQWLDLIWPIFLILKLETVSIHPGDTKMTPLSFDYYPFSHSLLYVIIWSVLFGGFYYVIRKDLKYSIILGLLVLSHWFLDLIVHRPDLPLYPGGPLEGFGLWNSPVIASIIEFLIFFAGIYFYLSATKAKNKSGIIIFWSLILFLLIIQIMNLFAPPPTDVKLIGYVSLSTWLIVLWAYWADKNREYISKSSKI